MTTEQFMNEYGNLRVKFSSYYKYTFTFTGWTPDGGRVLANVGGHRDEIYKLDVNTNWTTLAALDPDSALVKDDAGQVIVEYVACT